MHPKWRLLFQSIPVISRRMQSRSAGCAEATMLNLPRVVEHTRCRIATSDGETAITDCAWQLLACARTLRTGGVDVVGDCTAHSWRKRYSREHNQFPVPALAAFSAHGLHDMDLLHLP
jgi:hypothetical protein